MKKILLLAALASTSLPGVAMAGVCAGQSTYNVTVGGSCAGSAKFTPSTIPTTTSLGIYNTSSACGYSVDWLNPVSDAETPATTCNVAQVNTYGESSCGGAAQVQNPFASPLLSVSGCQGFDKSGVAQTVSFMLSDNSSACGMNGLATYSFYPYMIQPITFN